MKTIEGKIFKMQPAEEVLDFFKSRELEKIEVPPKNIEIMNNKEGLFLLIKKANYKEYPIRSSFIKKLLKWNALPNDLSEKIGNELFIKVLNETIKNFRSWYVDIYLEDGEAKTITSKLYTEVNNLEINEAIKNLKITKISHNDYLTRFYSKKKFESAPVINDAYGFGFDVVNSETGFAALALNHFILRYICSNGATAPINMYQWKQDHYAVDKDYLIKFVKNQIERADTSRNYLIQKIKKSADEKSIFLKQQLVSKVNYLIDRRQGARFFNGFNWAESKYELFNFITHNAKPFDINKRYQLERLAGELILN